MRDILREHGVELRLGLDDEDDTAYKAEAAKKLEFDNRSYFSVCGCEQPESISHYRSNDYLEYDLLQPNGRTRYPFVSN